MEKFWNLLIPKDSGRLEKWWFISKLTLLFCFISILNVNASLFSQSKVSLSLKGATLKDILWELEQQTGFVFMYSSDDLNKTGKIDVDLKSQKLETALNACLKGTGLTYSVKNDIIVLKAVAQQDARKITGVVKDTKGQVIPGVTVLIKGTSIGVATDIDGKYTIMLNDFPNPILLFSAVGMKTKEIKVGTSANIDVILEEDIKEMDEVVVVGYQTIHKRNVTGSVSSVRGEALADIPAASITELLSGKVAGLQSLSTGGGPGSKNALVIRGNTVMSGNLGEANEFSDPLYVIDGIPTDLQSLAGYDVTNSDFLASLNPDDVESIDILKDASAAAIYGSRGANGVIIIKTKAGRAGKLKVTAKATMGVNLRPKLKGILVGSAERAEKLRLMKESWSYNAWKNSMPMLLSDSLNPAFNNNIDYQGMFYQTGITQDYSLALDGGTEELNYRLSLGYYNEKGIVKANGMDRFSMTLNLSQHPFKSLRNQTVIRLSYTDRQTGTGSLDDNGNANGHNTFPMDLTKMRSSLFYMTDDQLNYLQGQLEDLYNKNRILDVSLSNYANLEIWKGITLNSQIGLTYNHTKTNFHQPSTVRTEENNYARYYWGQTKTASIETYLSYTRDVAQNHNVNILAGTSFDYTQNETSDFKATGGSGDIIHTISGYNKADIDGNTDISQNAMLSYWARLGYRFMNRYMVDFNFRRDASSRFGKNNRWANFPAVSFGWIFTDEPFLAGINHWFNYGKLKFSYGKNGKQFSDNYLRYNMYTLGYNGLGGYAGQVANSTYNGITAVVPDFSQLADNNLSWEESKQWNLGAELEFFNRRLFVNLDVYNRKTDALLFGVAFPDYTGFSQVQSNVAGIMNYGFELSFDAYLFPRDNDFQIQLQPSITHNNNMVTKLPNDDRDYINSDYSYGYTVGKPGPVYYGLNYVGPIDKLSDLPVNPFTGLPLDPTKGGIWGTAKPGYPLWEDINGNYLVSDNADEDTQLIDKNSNPKVQGFLNLQVSYKQWRLRVNSEFVFGRDIYDHVSKSILDRYDRGTWDTKASLDLSDYSIWTGEGSGGYYPSLLVSVPGEAGRYAYRGSSMYWENGNYWKVRDITLSYNFNQEWMKKIGFDRIYVYGTVYNVWQWQKSKTVVDATAVDSRGYTYGDGYPQARKFVFGLNVQF